MRTTYLVLLLTACQTPAKPMPPKEAPRTAAEQAEYDQVESSADPQFALSCKDPTAPGSPATEEWCARRCGRRKDPVNQKRWLLRALADEEERSDVCTTVEALAGLSMHPEDDFRVAKRPDIAFSCWMEESQKPPCSRQCEVDFHNCTDHAELLAPGVKRQTEMNRCGEHLTNCLVACH